LPSKTLPFIIDPGLDDPNGDIMMLILPKLHSTCLTAVVTGQQHYFAVSHCPVKHDDGQSNVHPNDAGIQQP
jgi:hypothetical protein